MNFEIFESKLKCEYSSQATLKNYMCVARAYNTYLETATDKDPAVLLRRYIILKLQGKAAKTINLHRAAIFSLYRLVEGIVLENSDVPRRKEPKKLPVVINSGAVLKAIAAEMNLKHRLILQIFYGCGIRLWEMQNIRVKNVRSDKNYLWLQDTKGQKERIIPIPKSVRGALYSYISEKNPEDLIFGGLCGRTFGKVVSNAFARVGVKASPHKLRHSFATDQVASGQPVEKVQHWLGHSEVETTMIYVHLSEAQLSESTDLLKEKGV
jgi:integrase/recombinase XerD